MRVDFATDIGTRLENEDRYVILSNKDVLGVHVMDGHSGSGAVDVCEACLENDVLPKIDGNIQSENAEIVRGLQNICSGKSSGTTLSSIYITQEAAFASILGDSPIIIIKDKQVKRLSLHDANNKQEVELRLKAGMYRNAWYPNHLFVNENAGLSCFRSIGDKVFGDALGREPEFHILEKDFDYIIVASDGLKLSDKDILNSVNKGADYMIKKNKKFLDKKSVDNTTIAIIRR